MNRLITFSVIVLISFLTSCNKGKLIEEFYFTEEMSAQIPFKGFETLSYTDANSNNIVLLGGDRIREIHKVTECVSCSDYYYFETAGIEFSFDSFKLNLSMEASPLYRFSIGLTIEETVFFCNFYDNLPLSNDNLNGKEVFFDSIIVNNYSYNNVFGDTLKHTGVIPISPYPVFCYYSTEYGVLKIDFSDSTYWELESIEW